MEQQTVKKRGWVKNAAIIFLAAMLVLTFFSNTILNRSLPEAATVLCMPGTIDSKVRISGTVSAAENYSVILDQTRKVLSVAVKQGQEVSTGDLLFTLEAGDSTELEQAKEELHQAELNYQRALLGATSSDYARENRSIEQAGQAVTKAQERADALLVTPEDYAAAQQAVDAAKAAVTDREAEVQRAKADVNASSQAYKDAQYGFNHSSTGSGFSGGSTAGMQAAVTAAQDALSAAADELNAAHLHYDSDYNTLKAAALDDILAAKSISLSAADKAVVLDAVDEQLKSVKTNPGQVLDSAADAVTGAPAVSPDTTVRAYLSLMPYYMQLKAAEYAAVADTDPAYAAAQACCAAYQQVRAAAEAYEAAENALESAVRALDEANSNVSFDGDVYYDGKSHSYWEKETERCEKALADAQDRQTEAETALADARTALSEVQAEQDALKAKDAEHTAALAEVESARNTLAELIFNLEEQKKSDSKSAALTALDLQEQANQIAKLKARVEELSGEGEDFAGTEIRAKVNGTVTSVSVSAGRKANAGDAVMEIEVSDLGYTMTATVTLDQARLLHVGDTATVSNYYWGNPSVAEITQIRPDPKNPQDSRLVTFAVTGNVTAGSTLSFSIGEKNASYDYVVPNAAVRSDTNGSFILIITAKNSPLGNRYYATRVNVEVVASDDLNSAIKGALDGHESVILTTSNNAPLKNGDQVRLPDVN